MAEGEARNHTASWIEALKLRMGFARQKFEIAHQLLGDVEAKSNSLLVTTTALVGGLVGVAGLSPRAPLAGVSTIVSVLAVLAYLLNVVLWWFVRRPASVPVLPDAADFDAAMAGQSTPVVIRSLTLAYARDSRVVIDIARSRAWLLRAQSVWFLIAVVLAATVLLLR